jgi:hypothetical protein
MRNGFNTHLLEQAKQHISNDEDDDAAVLRGQLTWTKISPKTTKRSLSLTPIPSLPLKLSPFKL